MNGYAMKMAALALGALLASGCDDTLKGNGRIVGQPRSVGEFSRVSVQTGLRAQLTVGPGAVTLSFDENLLDAIETFSEGGELVVRVKPGVSISPSEKSHVDIAGPLLGRLECSGGAKARAEVAPVEKFSLVASGGSQVELNGLDSNDVSLEASGGSVVRLTGTSALHLDLNASGGSRVDSSVATRTLEVEASGGSMVSVFASEAARGAASGGSTITITGSPSVREFDTSGGSTVSYRQ